MQRRSAPWRAGALPQHGDPGLQPERTVLSWGRTNLALTVCALLLLRWIPDHGPAPAVVAIALVVGGSTLWLIQRRRSSHVVHRFMQERTDPAVYPMLALTLLILFSGLAAILII
ncbi:MAG: DUF202 domain-containing protein [Cumulibacter sp.]